MIKVSQLYTKNSYRNFNYFICFDEEAIVIDPYSSEQVIQYLESNNLKLKYIINTHEHFDHIAANLELKSKTNCRVLVGEFAKSKIGSADRFLKDEERILLSKNSYLKVIHTPGHTPAHICLQLFLENKMHAIFTGDTLFNAGVGNCNSGDPDQLFETITKKFKKLPLDVLIYPGHDYWENNLEFAISRENDNDLLRETLNKYKELLKKNKFLVSTFELETKINPFLRLESPSIIEGLKERCEIDHKLSEKEVFLILRRIRDKW